MYNKSKPQVARKLAVRHLSCPTASFLATGGFKFQLFQNVFMVDKHAVVAASHIYAQRGEAAKRGGCGVCALNK